MKQKLLFLMLLLATFSFGQRVDNFWPDRGGQGTSVLIAGSGFSTTLSNNVVYIEGVKCTVTAASATNLTITIPNGVRTGKFRVTNLETNKVYQSSKFFYAGFNISYDIQGNYDCSPITVISSNGQYLRNQTQFSDLNSDGKVDIYTTRTTVGTSPSPIWCSYNGNGYWYHNDAMVSRNNNSSSDNLISSSNFASEVQLATSGNLCYDQGYAASLWYSADMTGNGYLDHMTYVVGHSEPHVLYRNTGSSYAVTAQFISRSATLGDLIDVDGDGKLDFYGSYPLAPLANNSGSGLEFHRNTSTTTGVSLSFVNAALSKPNTAIAFSKTIDLNADGLEDIVFFTRNATNQAFTDRRIYAYKNNGEGTFAYNTLASRFSITGSLGSVGNYNINDAVFHDFDGDGYLDMYIALNGSGTIKYFRNTSNDDWDPSTISFDSPIDIPTPHTSISQLKLIAQDHSTGDSFMIVSGNQGVSYLYLWATTSYSEGYTLDEIPQPRILTSAISDMNIIDLNGDGIFEIVGKQGGDVKVFKHNPFNPQFYINTDNLTTFSKCASSSAQPVSSIEVEGYQLSDPVVFPAVTGYQYSLDGVTYSNTLTLTPDSQNEIPLQTIYIKSTLTGSGTNTLQVTSVTCGFQADSVTLTRTINSAPTISTQPNNINWYVCRGSIPETISVVATGTGLSYQWYRIDASAGYYWETSNTGAVPIAGATTSSYEVPTNSLGYREYFVRITNDSGCSVDSWRTSSEVVVPLTISIGAISGPSSISTQTTATFTVPVKSGATNYVWVVPPGMTITSSTGNSIQVSISSQFSGGTVSVSANNGCSSTNDSTRFVSKQNTNLPLTIVGASTICLSEGSVTQNYSVASVPGATSYNWIVPSGATLVSGRNTNSISISFNSSYLIGTLKVSALGSNGVIASGTLGISGMEMPGTITGPTQICTAGTYEYSITAVAGATSYEWILPTGMTLQGNGSGTTISVTTTGSVSGNISVKAISSCGSSQARTFRISALPTPGYIYGERVICGGNSAITAADGTILSSDVNNTNYNTYYVSEVEGATSYSWTLPTGAEVYHQNGRVIIVYFTDAFQSGTISVVANSANCGSSMPRSITVTTSPTVLSGPTNICGLATATYVLNAQNPTDIVWTLPEGMSISSGEGTNSITVSINHPINFSNNNNKVSVSFTTACSTTKEVSLTVDCPDYSYLTNCGSTVAFNERVYTRSVSGATMYAFDIYDSTSSTLLTTYETRGNFFQFVQALPSFEFGVTYNVKVRIKKNGVYGIAGSACSITLTTPVTAIQTSQCNQTVTTEDRVYATSVWNGVTYAFDIYNSEGDLITTLEKTSNFFRMGEFASVYGMTYQVGVRVKRGNGSYGEQGSRCNVTIAIPTTSLVATQCGATINIADRIYARSVANATMYAFRIYDENGIFITELERPYNFFRITDIAYTIGASYKVGVKVKQGEGAYGLEGTLCNITIAKDSTPTRSVETIDEVKSNAVSVFSAYPNPFTTSFTITPIDGETQTLFYQVYDVTGKMIESKSVEATEVMHHRIGTHYQSGMYLVMVRQGATTTTFKMIKQE